MEIAKINHDDTMMRAKHQAAILMAGAKANSQAAQDYKGYQEGKGPYYDEIERRRQNSEQSTTTEEPVEAKKEPTWKAEAERELRVALETMPIPEPLC